MKTFEQIKQLDKKYYMPVFNRFDVCFTRAGCKLYDIEGKEYIDFGAGIAVNCLGHNDEELANAISNRQKKQSI